METDNSISKTCRNCKVDIVAHHKFCNFCGAVQNQLEINDVDSKWLLLKQVALFFAIQVACCLLPLAVEEESISTIFLMDLLSAIIVLMFFGYNFKENIILLKWKNFSFLKLISYSILTILGSITVQFLIGHLNLILFNKDYSFYEPFRSHPYGKILMIISIAVFPAIFEEMAFRGFVMEKLTKVVDNQQAIYISSFMFFIIHFSLVSVFWLLPFAILLGYLRIKEKTIWYGIAIHFLFNLTACLGEIFNLS